MLPKIEYKFENWQTSKIGQKLKKLEQEAYIINHAFKLNDTKFQYFRLKNFKIYLVLILTKRKTIL